MMQKNIYYPVHVGSRWRGHFSASDLQNINVFKKAVFKIGLQKNGELTHLSKVAISSMFNLPLPKLKSSDRRLFTTIDSGKVGIFLAKNTDLCFLVDSGFIDTAIVGSDSVAEYKESHSFKVVKDLSKIAKWALVIATPVKSKVNKLRDIHTVATQYPKLVKILLTEIGLTKLRIVTVKGSCEGMIYLSNDVDAIVDLTITGKTLHDNGLTAWYPPLTHISPVVIANKISLLDTKKKKYFDQIYKN